MSREKVLPMGRWAKRERMRSPGSRFAETPEGMNRRKGYISNMKSGGLSIQKERTGGEGTVLVGTGEICMKCIDSTKNQSLGIRRGEKGELQK